MQIPPSNYDGTNRGLFRIEWRACVCVCVSLMQIVCYHHQRDCEIDSQSQTFWTMCAGLFLYHPPSWLSIGAVSLSCLLAEAFCSSNDAWKMVWAELETAHTGLSEDAFQPIQKASETVCVCVLLLLSLDVQQVQGV